MRYRSGGATRRWLALALSAAVAPALAATVIKLSMEELTQRADVVVRARVRSAASSRDPATGRIWTFTELDVSESIKGDASKAITVRQPGGVVDGIGQEVAGTARFSPGEDVVLFLARAPDHPAVFQVLSLAAGKVRLEPRLSSKRAVRDLEGLQFHEQPAQAVAHQRASGVHLVSTEDLGDSERFLKRIRAAAKPRSGAEP
jgi:hypothetical protein